MIAAWTTLDTTVNQIRLRLASGFRAAFSTKYAQRRVEANNHHEVEGIVRRSVMPCPSRRPKQRQRIQANTRDA